MSEDLEAMKMGITCIECHSVIFSIGKLIQHKRECKCNYFKQGKGDLVLYINLLTQSKE